VEGKLNLLDKRRRQPLEALCTDFTEISSRGRREEGPRYGRSRERVGGELGARANQELALACWAEAKGKLAEVGRGPQGLTVHHDQDLVYTNQRRHSTLQSCLSFALGVSSKHGVYPPSVSGNKG